MMLKTFRTAIFKSLLRSLPSNSSANFGKYSPAHFVAGGPPANAKYPILSRKCLPLKQYTYISYIVLCIVFTYFVIASANSVPVDTSLSNSANVLPSLMIPLL